jgi:hypothetical protein
MSQPGRPRHYLYRRRPVKIMAEHDGEATVWCLDPGTGAWITDRDLAREIARDIRIDQLNPLTPRQFIDIVETIRAATLTGDGAVFALYETITAIHATVEAEQRRPTPEEMALLGGLRQRAYRMFEDELARGGNPAAEPDLLVT